MSKDTINDLRALASKHYAKEDIGRKLSALNALGFALHAKSGYSEEARTAASLYQRIEVLEGFLEERINERNRMQVIGCLRRISELADEVMELYTRVGRQVFSN